MRVFYLYFRSILAGDNAPKKRPGKALMRQRYIALKLLRDANIMLAIVVLALLVTTGARLGNDVAQKASVPKPQDNPALGEDEVKKLLLLMDTDKNGRVSKQTFMKLMEEEFERLDKNKTGELDAKELNQSSPRAKHVGK
jgi:uncharacterized protein YneF (UPF0154 family)